MTTFASRATSGFAWMLSGSAAQQGVAFVVTVVLARLLAPEEFGAVAIVAGLISILLVFAELGLSVAVVQRPALPRKLIDTAFFCTVVFTASIVALLFIVADHVATFFDTLVLAPLLKVLAFSYLAQGISAIYNCLLLREMRYRRIAALRLLSNIVYGTVAIGLAILGAGAFSMVWGQVASGVALLLGGALSTRYVPRSIGGWNEARELLAFGLWVSSGRVLGNAAGRFDAFLIGKLLDMSTLGAYSLAQKLALFLPTAITGVLDQVMLPIYSRWQSDPGRVGAGYWTTLQYVGFLALPPVVLLALTAEHLVPLVFGAKWQAAVPLLQIMSLFAAMQCLGGGIFGAVIYAMGKPKIILMVNAFRIVALPVCVMLGANFGVLGVAWGFGIYSVIGRLFNQWLLKVHFGFGLIEFFRCIRLPVLLNVAGFIAGVPLFAATPSEGQVAQAAWLITAVGVWLAAYAGMLALFAPEQWRKALDLFWPPGKLFTSKV